MSVQPVDTGSDERPGVVAAVALCSCSVISHPSAAGEIVVLRVAGEVDLSSLLVLQDALTGILARRPRDLLVDLAGLTFCDVRGLALLVEAGRTAGSHGTGYALSAAPRQAHRVWTMLWDEDELPTRHRTAGAAFLAAARRPPASSNRPLRQPEVSN